MTDIDELLKEAPTLTFDAGLGTPAAEEKATAAKAEEAPKMEEVELTEEEKKMVADFASQIDITNTQMVLQYGAGCQKKIADFSESALGSVRTKDLGEVGDMLTSVIGELRAIGDEEESKGIFGFFKKSGDKLSAMKA